MTPSDWFNKRVGWPLAKQEVYVGQQDTEDTRIKKDIFSGVTRDAQESRLTCYVERRSCHVAEG